VNDLTSVAEATGFTAAVALSEVPVGWVLRTSVAGREIALANQDGSIYALGNSCTHAGGPLGDNRLSTPCMVECPWHNSVFDIRTGEAVQGPARKPVKTYEVMVEAGMVFVKV
jgi:nitrite reductase/ring-hydroxylating ferredoxin subunit